jgi:predicted nucleic acid-binding protein
VNRPFLDTNVLLYSLAGGDPRQAVAVRLLAAGGTISIQVLNEFASVAHRKMRLSWPEVARALSDVRALCSPPVPLTLATHEQAVKLAARDGIAFYDASIVPRRWKPDAMCC